MFLSSNTNDLFYMIIMKLKSDIAAPTFYSSVRQCVRFEVLYNLLSARKKVMTTENEFVTSLNDCTTEMNQRDNLSAIDEMMTTGPRRQSEKC